MADRIPVLVGITTIPSRISFMRPCLESLLGGLLVPDRIFVSVPEFSIRENTAYAIPDFFHDQRFSEKVEVIRVARDCGPGTKLLGMLGKIDQPSYIVLVDDDLTYKPFLLRRLIESQRRDHHSSFSFFNYSLLGLQVGQGHDGFSFWSPNLAGIFDFYTAYVANTDLMFHDDLWISFYLMSRGVRVQSLQQQLEGTGQSKVYDDIHTINALADETGRLSRPRLNGLVFSLFNKAAVPKKIFQELLKSPPDDPCICGSGKSYAQCHGAPI